MPWLVPPQQHIVLVLVATFYFANRTDFNLFLSQNVPCAYLQWYQLDVELVIHPSKFISMAFSTIVLCLDTLHNYLR